MEGAMLWIWLGVFVLAVILEALTQDFISIWFAAGAIVCLIICTWIPWWLEIIIFCAVSFVALLATRPLVKKFAGRGTIRYTNVDEFVGKRVKVEKEITKYEAGEVKINGIVYSAILMEDSEETISLNSIVEVVALKGNKIVVKKIEE